MATTTDRTATRLFERGIIRLSGDDPTGFLQGLVTSDLTGALPVWTALLSPQGKALFDFFVWPAGEGLLLDCEAAHADELVERLSRYRLRRKLDIAVDPGVELHWTAHRGDGGADDPRLAALGQRWLAPAPAAKPEQDQESPCADEAYRAHRLRIGVPEGRAELGFDETLWLECNAGDLAGVSFNKGCFIGQENTARMNWRQKVNRRLVVVPLDRSDEARRRVAYPELSLAVDHLRLADADPALLPGWMKRSAEPSG